MDRHDTPHCSGETEGGTTTAVLEDTEVAIDEPRTVVVWDDPVNLMTYVVMVFRKVFPSWSREDCERRMLEVHHQGRSSVFTGPREECELVAAKIQAFQLWVTVEQ
jgi:ATP-dependent Clp protease adaptor protein ClpS